MVYLILYIINIGEIDILVDLITLIIRKKGVVPGPIGNLNNSDGGNEIQFGK